MKAKLSLILITSALTATIFGCAGGGGTQETPKAALNITPAQLAVKKDPVCGMDFTNAKTITDTAMYNGGIYAFCSDDCKEKFKSDPSKYLK